MSVSAGPKPPDQTPQISTTWFDDDEELTEIESDEEDDPTPPPPYQSASAVETKSSTTEGPRSKTTRAATQNATQKSKERSGGRPTITLEAPRTSNHSIKDLYRHIRDGLVDLNPEYQRGVVWNDKKQSDLINSLYSNFYVPPIVFTLIQTSDGLERRICIDGKQRLTSIFRFFSGEIAYKDSATNRKHFYKNPPKIRRKLLTDAEYSKFKFIQISCVEYSNLTQEQEREIFQRVQLGVALAPADRLPAINGPYADLVRSLRQHIEAKKGFELYLDWGKARGKDFQALAQIVYLIAHGHQPKKAEPTAARLEAFLGNHATEKGFNDLQQNATNTMDGFCRIVADDMLGAPLKKLLTPIEFVMASYLVYKYQEKLSDVQLSDAMARMRADFKRACPDMKYTTKNFKHILAFVQKEVPKLVPKLKQAPAVKPTTSQASSSSNGAAPRKEATNSRQQTADIAMKVTPAATPSVPEAKPKKESTVSKKRPRRVEDDEYDSDSDVVIIKPKAKKLKLDPTATPKAKSALGAAKRSAATVVRRPASSATKGSASTGSSSKGSMGLTMTVPTATGSASTPLSKASIPAAATATTSTAGAKAQAMPAQRGKPSVRPQASARTGLVSSVSTLNVKTGKDVTPSALSGPSTLHQGPPPASSASVASSVQSSVPLASSRPPLPSRLNGRSPSVVPPARAAVPSQTMSDIGNEVSKDALLLPSSSSSTSSPVIGSASEPTRADPFFTRSPHSMHPLASGGEGRTSTTAMEVTPTVPAAMRVPNGAATSAGTTTAREGASVESAFVGASLGMGGVSGQRSALPKINKYGATATGTGGGNVAAIGSSSGGQNGTGTPPLGPRSVMETRTLASYLKSMPVEMMACKKGATARTPTASSSNTPAASPTIQSHAPGQREQQKQPRQPQQQHQPQQLQPSLTRHPRLTARESTMRSFSDSTTPDETSSLFSPPASATSSPVIMPQEGTVPDIQALSLSGDADSTTPVAKRGRQVDQDETSAHKKTRPSWMSTRDGFNR